MNHPLKRLAMLARTTTFQLAVSYSLLFAISLSALTLFFYWSTIGLLVRETDATLKSEITGLAEQYIEHGLDRLAQVIAHRIRTDDSGNMLYLFATRDNRPLAGNLKQWPQAESDDDGWIEFTHASKNRAVVPARGRVYLLKDGLHLLVGRNIEQIEQLRRVFNRAMLVALGMTAVLAVAGGFFMSHRVQQRVNRLNRTIGEITEGRLEQRLETRGTGDEFDVLASNLNDMLARLETLLATVRHVSDNIAHDLRTPLTRLRNRIELAAREIPVANRAELERSVEEADELLATFSSLLRIARIESGSYEPQFEPVNLDTVLTDVIDLYQGVAQERELTIVTELDPDLMLAGDRNLLFQAVANLIDNATKFSPAGAAIEVRAERGNRRLEIMVCDAGPGIPSGEHGRVTQRFARLDSSRSLPGTGLGLSLVSAVVQMHNGQLSFEDNTPGLRVRLSLPYEQPERARLGTSTNG